MQVNLVRKNDIAKFVKKTHADNKLKKKKTKRLFVTNELNELSENIKRISKKKDLQKI